MKIYYLCFVILISNCFSYGQNIPFPTDSATWIMDMQTETFTFPPQTFHVYYYYRTSGDTLINNKQYTIISVQGYPKYCFLREANDTVFCKYSLTTVYDTTEFPLYSFNHSIGDSLSLPMINSGSVNYFPSTVSNVDSILIGNSLHKRITINSWIEFQFVEGVGALQGLMYCEIPLVDWWGDLTCFSRNDTIFSTNGTGQFNLGKCWYPTDIKELNTKSFNLFPNPTESTLTINAQQELSNITILDVKGNSVTNFNLDGNIIDISNLKPGIYILKIISESEIITKKFIKN